MDKNIVINQASQTPEGKIMPLPRISIIIPIYNVEDYIMECLQSVARQTYRGEAECIIIDDCGKDSSAAIAEQFIQDYNGRFEFVLLHHKVNRGLSAARNTGMEHATGDYYFFLDSDDYIAENCLEVLASRLSQTSFALRTSPSPGLLVSRCQTIQKQDFAKKQEASIQTEQPLQIKRDGEFM